MILRIEDHDRQRSRPAYEAAMLDDLERLGLLPDEPALAAFRAGPTPYRQSDALDVYAAALDRLRDDGLVYACTCTRSTFAAYEAERGRPWRGIGCPGGCRERQLPEDEGTSLRVAVGAGTERWIDLLAGPMADEPAAAGDLVARDRVGNWTYGFCVVVDDQRHGIDLVIRGRDLLDATPVQLRLARLLGRETPPSFLHHPLVRRVSGPEALEVGGRHRGPRAARRGLDAGRPVRARRPPRGPSRRRLADRTRRPRFPVRGWHPVASGCVQAQPISGSFARAQASTPPSGRTIHATFGFGPEKSRQRTECRPVSTADDGKALGSAYGRTVCVAKIPPGSRR